MFVIFFVNNSLQTVLLILFAATPVTRPMFLPQMALGTATMGDAVTLLAPGMMTQS